MPQIIIQIRDAPGPMGYRDNDIIHAWNDTYLLWLNTQRLTDHRKLGGGFFKPRSSLAYRRLRMFSKWKFERVSSTEVRRTRLADMSERVFSSTPNAQGHSIHVPLYVARRMAAGKKAMFGDEANAVWFGGTRGVTLARMTTLWANYITPRTGFAMADYKRHDGTSYLKGYLVIVTNDFSNERRGRLEAPDIDDTDPDNPIMLAPRKRNIDWRNLPDMTGTDIDSILNRRKRFPIRRDLIRDETSVVRTRVRI